MAIMIDGLEMPKENERLEIVINPSGKVTYSLDLKCKQIATARPINHGKWIEAPQEMQNEENLKNDNKLYICSSCDAGDVHSITQIVPYCWNCGAKMVWKEKKPKMEEHM